MTAALAVMAFHLLTWQRHFRCQGGSGGVSDRSCPCVSFCMCKGLVFSLIVVREWDDMSGRIWWDFCFQHVADQSHIMTIQMDCSEASKFCVFLPFFFHNLSFLFFYDLQMPALHFYLHILEQHIRLLVGQKFSHITSSAAIYGSSLIFQHVIVIPEVT